MDNLSKNDMDQVAHILGRSEAFCRYCKQVAGKEKFIWTTCVPWEKSHAHESCRSKGCDGWLPGNSLCDRLDVSHALYRRPFKGQLPRDNYCDTCWPYELEQWKWMLKEENCSRSVKGFMVEPCMFCGTEIDYQSAEGRDHVRACLSSALEEVSYET